MRDAMRWVIAVAVVLMVPIIPFLWPVYLSNLGIAAAYAALGDWSRHEGTMLFALAASIAVPLLAVTMARSWWRGGG